MLGEAGYPDVLIAYQPVINTLVIAVVAVLTAKVNSKQKEHGKELKRLNNRLNGEGFTADNDYNV